MKKSILTLGKALNRVEQKTITGGGIPCFEWCALDPLTQSMIAKPLFCSCRSGGGGNGNPGNGGSGGGPVDPV
ncbi:conserved protein of unknown function [Tenacibaculum sp. 190130A14a]|uniref:Bacteriocin n=1 Tax=Tenacibaculum polynesiense TaxID=3137857 RepID=A0ABM9PGG1_9FLAO